MPSDSDDTAAIVASTLVAWAAARDSFILVFLRGFQSSSEQMLPMKSNQVLRRTENIFY